MIFKRVDWHALSFRVVVLSLFSAEIALMPCFDFSNGAERTVCGVIFFYRSLCMRTHSFYYETWSDLFFAV